MTKLAKSKNVGLNWHLYSWFKNNWMFSFEMYVYVHHVA